MGKKQRERDIELREKAISLTPRGRELLNNSTMRKIGKGTYVLDRKPLKE